jgi:flagellar hook protein FlgE
MAQREAQEELIRQKMYEENMRRQMSQAPQQTHQPAQQEEEFTITVNLNNGKQLQIPNIPGRALDALITKINNAIEQQTTLEISNTVVNGRYITDYQVD